MSKANESAFPYIHKWKHQSFDGEVELSSRGNGLTKREYFAAMAMQGFIAGCYAGNNSGFTPLGNCVAAVEYADALLAELEKDKE